MRKNMRTPEAKDELVAALGYIEMHPEEWNQDQWFCGSSACLGGRAALMSADVEKVYQHPADVKGVNGRIVGIHDWLATRYGSDASPLWSGTNDLEMLRVGVKAYCNDENVYDAIARYCREGT